MYESAGSHYFRTTKVIQPGLEAFDNSKFVMCFLTNQGVTGILCIFRLVTEWKVGKEIHESSRLQFILKC